MDFRIRLAVLLTALAQAACGGDPIIVLGDPPGTMRILAGIPDSAGSHVGERGPESLLNRPRGVVVDERGVVYIADFGSRRVLSVTSAGSVQVHSNFTGCPVASCPGRPLHLALAPDGALLLTDQDAGQLWRIDTEGGSIEILAGAGANGSSPDGTSAPDAALATPWGIAADGDGRVYFSERGGHRVRVLLADGTLGTVAGTGVAGFSGDGGPAVDAQLSSPSGLALQDGRLFIADTENSRIRMVDLGSGRIETVAGSGVRAYGGDGGDALSAQLRRPEAVAVTVDGRSLFVADAGNNRVRRVDLFTGIITTFVGTGEPDFTGNLGAAGDTGLNNPGGVATSPFGILFIADTDHHLVWRTTVER